MYIRTHTVAETVSQEYIWWEFSTPFSIYFLISGTDITYSSGRYFHLDPLQWLDLQVYNQRKEWTWHVLAHTLNDICIKCLVLVLFLSNNLLLEIGNTYVQQIYVYLDGSRAIFDWVCLSAPQVLTQNLMVTYKVVTNNIESTLWRSKSTSQKISLIYRYFRLKL